MKRSILEEAMEDARLLKETAIENAKNVLVEAISPQIKEFVDGQLGEVDAVVEMPAYENDEKDRESEEEEEDDEEMDETFQFEGNDEREDEEEDEMEEGIETVEIANEDLRQAFSEMIRAEAEGLQEAQVSSGFGDADNPNDVPGGLGDKSAPGERGLEDKEKEEMWKDHEPPGSEDWTVKEAAYRQRQQVLASQNKKLKVENAEYEKVVNYLRRNLQEVNLFNSKLLYTNKLLQSTDLNNKQRSGVIEAFDRAESLREVELVFKSLSESLKIAGVLGESRQRKVSRSSRNAGSGGTSKLLEEQRQAQSGDESFSQRMQRLSGILGD